MSGTSHPPELSPAQFAHLQNEALSWAHAHGLAVIPPTSPLGNAHPHTLTQHAPITLFPSTFPKAAFEEAVSVQKDYNELYVGIVREKEWLRGIVEELAKVDDFIAGLWNVYKEVQRIGFVQVRDEILEMFMLLRQYRISPSGSSGRITWSTSLHQSRIRSLSKSSLTPLPLLSAGSPPKSLPYTDS